MVERMPAEVFSPGEYLRDELEERGWTQTEFAEIIGRPTRLVNEIIGGKRGISAVTAKEIGAALGTSAIYWLNLESAYQLKKGDAVPKRIAREAKLRERFPVREMLRRRWIEPTDSSEVLENRVLQYFKIKSLDERPQFEHAARKTTYSDSLTPAQEAWLFRVRQIARSMRVKKFSDTALTRSLDALRECLASPEGVRHVPRILGEAGVRFVIVEPLPGSKIDGVCFWLEGRRDTPVIGMSLRFDRIDNFWFVLRHEIEHVLRGEGRDAALVDIELGGPQDIEVEAQLPLQERVANEAAAEFCVAEEAIGEFMQRVHPMYWETRIAGFAQRLGIHPGIVAGQLRRRTAQYNILGRHLSKVRDIVVPAAMTDGYGRFCSVEA